MTPCCRPGGEVCVLPADQTRRTGRRDAGRIHIIPPLTGSQCTACHMPKIEQTIADVNVASHTFHFVYPDRTDSLGVPNACNACHNDKSTAWATQALRHWKDRSPWREAD